MVVESGSLAGIELLEETDSNQFRHTIIDSDDVSNETDSGSQSVDDRNWSWYYLRVCISFSVEARIRQTFSRGKIRISCTRAVFFMSYSHLGFYIIQFSHDTFYNLLLLSLIVSFCLTFLLHIFTV